MKVAVIPARGGSKRIPRKNIRRFAGKPMIAYSIAAARECGLFDRIIVSTDDSEIAEVAKSYGSDVPFLRPEALSNDFAGTTEVIAHVIRWMLDQQWSIDAVCCIYATAPFVRAEDIRRGLDALESGSWDYAFAVTEFASPIFRSFRLHSEGGIEMFFPDQFSTRSQDLPVALHDAGQFYWGRPQAWLENKPIFDRHSFPLIIPRWRVQDIDTEADWRRAELMMDAISRSEDD